MEMDRLTILSSSLQPCIGTDWKEMNTYTKHFSFLTWIVVGKYETFQIL